MDEASDGAVVFCFSSEQLLVNHDEHSEALHQCNLKHKSFPLGRKCDRKQEPVVVVDPVAG